MDHVSARLECLKQVLATPEQDHSVSSVLDRAKAYADFVIGTPVKESASAGKRGADDHLAEQPAAPKPFGNNL